MNFKKDNFLSGYPVTIADVPLFYDPTIKNQIKFDLINGRILEEVLSPLQPTINIKVVLGGSFAYNENETLIGSSLLKILNGTFDTRVIPQNQRFFGEFWRNELNAFTRTGVYVIADITESRNEFFEQNFFSTLFLSAIYNWIIIETILKHFFKKYKIEVVMNLLRALIGNATLWEPKSSFKRIIFLSIIFSFTIITSFLQSKLTSVIAITPKAALNIETIDDLVNSKYEVFTVDNYRQFFLSTPFYSYIQTSVEVKVFNSLNNNFSVAWAGDCSYLRDMAQLPENIKILPDKYLQSYSAYTFPVDYPLLPRIRKIYYKLYEGGIIGELLKLSSRSESKSVIEYNQTTLNELRFVLKFYLCGSLLSSIAFFIEIVTFKHSQSIRKISQDAYHNVNSFF